MAVIGMKFKNFEAFLPELLLAADAFKSAMNVLRPHLGAAEEKKLGFKKVVIGTVFGDVHDLGLHRSTPNRRRPLRGGGVAGFSFGVMDQRCSAGEPGRRSLTVF